MRFEDLALRAGQSIVRAASILVPRGTRREWLSEWDAELTCRAMALRRWGAARQRLAAQVVVRALGAVPHAFFLLRQEWRLTMLFGDLRFAARIYARRPIFTLVAATTLALAIGTNAAVFSLVQAVLVRALPFHEPDRLVQVFETNPERDWQTAPVAPANLLDWTARTRTIEAFAFYFGNLGGVPWTSNFLLTPGSEPADRLRGLQVSTNLFDVLGVPARLGRTFLPEERTPGQQRVVVLGDGVWRRRFGADPAVVGRDVRINARAYRVVGVMPPGFVFPSAEIELWAPVAYEPGEYGRLRKPHFFSVVARLRPSVGVDQARDDLARIARELEREYPETNTKMGVGVAPLHEFVVGGARRMVLVLVGAVSLVLLVACANIASLLLAQAAGRSREFAVRAALGASRARLVRQVLVESLALALTGGLLGSMVGGALVAVLPAIAPPQVPRLEQVALDPTTFLCSAVLCGITAILFGLLPAWTCSRTDASDWLRAARTATDDAGWSRRLLVAGQVALATVLLVGAALLVASFDRLRSVDPGFDPEQALTFKVTLPSLTYDTDEKTQATFDRLAAELRTLPGVVAVGGSTVLSLDGPGWTGDLSVESRPGFWGRELRHKTIVPGYFAAIGARVRRGRDLGAVDAASSPPVVVVNESFVGAYIDGDPVGKRISFTRPHEAPRWRTIVGVVGDERQDGLDRPVQPEAYVSHLQDPQSQMTMVMRSTTPPDRLVEAARARLARLDRDLALYDVRTLRQVVDRSIATQRFIAALLTGFAVAALVLAVAGITGVVALTVGRRSREVGIRVALGATRPQVLALVMIEPLVVVAAGLALGLATAWLTAGAMQPLLFDVRASHPAAYAAALALLLAATVLAGYLPARRALRLDPASVLREGATL